MRLQRFFLALAVIALIAPAVPVRADVGQSAGSAVQSANVPPILKLTVVISRYTAEKKTGSLPFILMVVPGDKEGRGDTTSLQTGAQVPIPSTSFSETTKQPIVSYQYRQFGTNITASAGTMQADVFSVNLTVNDSQLLSDVPEPGNSGGRLPRFQSFTSQNRLILRDGQTIQYTAATDKTSGEVIRLDVTLNVVR